MGFAVVGVFILLVVWAAAPFIVALLSFRWVKKGALRIVDKIHDLTERER